MLCALIMAGGKGTRFWPISTEKKPKQFLNLVGEDTMLQMTYKRIQRIIPDERIFICTGKKYVDLVKEQLPKISERNIIKEPEARNTAPCIVLSSLMIEKYYKDSNMVVLPADHLINNEDEFIEKVKLSNEFLNKSSNSIITIGIKPNRAEIGYGYIKSSNNKAINKLDIYEVEKFVEKPNIEKAEEYFKSEEYLWNSGMFLWNTKSIIEKSKKYIPNTYQALQNILKCEYKQIDSVIENNYGKTDIISIDYAILEKDNDIYVIPSDIGWDDIGTWQAVERYRLKDDKRNITLGTTSYIDGADNIVVSSGKQIMIDGLSNIYIIESEDKIIVGLKENIDKVKKLKDRIIKLNI
ncbi:mannose-1-phosphate guanylyltransferase [Clostridium butyricum]|uniref:mannose-1-phosphate guanylyltransferase n=1 Tax=Clostridium butyricum TaxID=1492 RepID=UPI0013CFF03D|nr:mannose-1-phosphate guanylyltransferase [Clostridium butyricum]MCQ2022242.1 mannose-1-phosphate guanylyltransferase [Clostridium butyricum]NFB70108.1 mannose-1-phosphate guanylyltransferase [Clostridium butyricum]NFB89895.1 mannose-1-phosphate guanylyltransferase [Clostridium butyricum]